MYRLEITAEEWKTIQFVGGRYGWSTALLDYHDHISEGPILESIAWDIAESFREDTEGGHSMFPMLDDRSDLAEKLHGFYYSIV